MMGIAGKTCDGEVSGSVPLFRPYVALKNTLF